MAEKTPGPFINKRMQDLSEEVKQEFKQMSTLKGIKKKSSFAQEASSPVRVNLETPLEKKEEFELKEDEDEDIKDEYEEVDYESE